MKPSAGRDLAWIPLAIAAGLAAIIGLLGLLVAALTVIPAFVFVAAPGSGIQPPAISAWLLAGAAFVVAVIGFAWMVRISSRVQRRGTAAAVSPPSRTGVVAGMKLAFALLLLGLALIFLSGTLLSGLTPAVLGRNALSLAAGLVLVIAGVIRALEVRMSGLSARR